MMASGVKILASHLTGASILVAEANPVARSSLAELFRYDGHRVYEAANSDAAIDHLHREAEIRVVMLDAEMQSWQSVVARVQDSSSTALILAMSAQDSSRSASDAKRHGVHGYLIKPLRFDDVCETILRLIIGRQVNAPIVIS